MKRRFVIVNTKNYRPVCSLTRLENLQYKATFSNPIDDLETNFISFGNITKAKMKLKQIKNNDDLTIVEIEFKAVSPERLANM